MRTTTNRQAVANASLLLIVHCLFPLLLLWRPLFNGEVFYWGTPLLQFVPWQRAAAEMWRSGRLPLWNALVGCGAPLAANYQTAAFYPLNALYLLLPAEVALNWTTALHLALAGWGIYRWARSVELARLPALVGALALQGSGFLVARVALFPSMAFTFPWIAVWLWRGEVLSRRRRVSDALWLALALGLGLLAGHAQTAYYGILLLAAYVAFRALRVGGRIWRAAFLFALSLLLGIALAGVQLLPTAELLHQSQRAAGVGRAFAMTYSLWPWRLITFLAPNFFGNPGHGNYWGYAAYWEDAGYVGLLPLLLALGVVWRAWRDRRKDTQRGLIRFWSLVALAALTLALGRHTPVFPFLFRHVPTFDLFQAPARWLALVTMALAALAAFGAQTWPRGHSGRRRGLLWIVIGAALLIAGVLAPRLAPQIPSTFGPATARLGGTVALAGGLVLLRRDAIWWRAAVVAFIACDLLIVAWPLVPTVDRALYQGSTATAAALARDADRPRTYWQTDPSLRRRDVVEYRVKFDYLTFGTFADGDVARWLEMRRTLLPNAGMLDGTASANNFDPLLVGRYADVLDAAVSSEQVRRAMGVTHLAHDRPLAGHVPVHQAGPVGWYPLSNALGRAWVVPAARQVSAPQALALLADADFNPQAQVLLEEAVPRSDQTAAAPYTLTLRDGANRITIRATLEASGYLVLADTWYPGWRARVDGEPAPLLRANYAFRAVRLEPGEHVVQMVYRPPSVLVGAGLSLSALAALGVGLALARRWEVRV